jgi:nickel/cobalt exporter
MPLEGLSLHLLLAAVGIAVLHTAVGPDHYLPFAMLARSRHWSLQRTLFVTAICGIGHVASSLLLGLLGILLGVAVGFIEHMENTRGDLAAWALIAIGLAYALWGTRQALRRRRGLELHTHDGGHLHLHTHGDKPHVHDSRTGRTAFWALFLVFVLGPCEPLIPLFLLPASRGDWSLAAMTGLAFGVATVLSMLGLVAVAYAGFERLRLGFLERWAETVAGVVIAGTGSVVAFCGL